MKKPKVEPSLTSKRKKRPLRLSKPAQWIREALALVLWMSAFIQFFVFDLGTYLASLIPGLEIILQFRFLILLVSIGLSLLVLGTRRFLLFIGYIIIYPFVVAFWIIPRLLFRNWAVLIAFSPAIYSAFKAFKINFALSTVALVSSFVICLAPPNKPVVIGSMAILGAYLVIHFFRRFRVAFSPSTVFADFGGVIGSVWGEMQKSESLTPRQHLDPETDEYNKEIAQRLLNVYLMAGVLCFIGERLREVVKSRKLDLYFLCSLLYTFLLLTLIFSIAYFGLERISPGSFIGISEANLLEFLGFSFSTLMTSDISPIKPVSGPAQVGTYLQLFSSLLIAVLLVFVILTSIRERYKQDLDNLVNEFRAASEKFDGFVEINYELTVVSAEILLFKFNPDVTKWCLKVMRGETRAREISESVDRAT